MTKLNVNPSQPRSRSLAWPAVRTGTSRYLVLSFALFFAACQSTHMVLEESREFAANGNYYLAYRVLENARDPNQPSEALEKAYWAARLEYLITEGRNQIFLDKEAKGLEFLNQALILAPDNKIVAGLIKKAHEKIARRTTARGETLLSEGDMEGALLAFTEAQREVPGFEGAIKGTQEVRETFSRLHQKAQEHFLEALRRFPELRWVQVDWHTTSALENDPSRADARVLLTKAQSKLAQRSFDNAIKAEKRGRYGAALMEFRAVLDLQPDFPGISEHLTQMANEVEAQKLSQQAFALMLRGNFTEARKVLEQAFALTVLEKTKISEAILKSRHKEADLAYQHAKDLELQNKKEEALAGFQALAATWPDGLKDEKVRIENLQGDIEHATKAFAAAEEAEKNGDLKAAIENYSTAATFYPGWRDVAERLARLKAQVQDASK